MTSYTWKGVSGNWNDADNWTPVGGPPTSADVRRRRDHRGLAERRHHHRRHGRRSEFAHPLGRQRHPCHRRRERLAERRIARDERGRPERLILARWGPVGAQRRNARPYRRNADAGPRRSLQFDAGVSTAATLGDQNIDFLNTGDLLRLMDPTDFYGEFPISLGNTRSSSPASGRFPASRRPAA